MPSEKAPKDLETRVRWTLESMGRSLDRRHFLSGALHAGTALAAGIALGSLNVARVLADNTGCKACTLMYGQTCLSLGYYCPSVTAPQCPSGCTVCKQCSCSQCCYAAGYWTVTGCGSCGLGHRYCTDCRCPNCAGGCTCRSLCTCCNCCSPQDVVIEMQRIRLEERQSVA
jgi:hypothetical protein